LTVAEVKASDHLVLIAGTVPAHYANNKILIEVIKDGEKEQLAWPIDGTEFHGEVPLYFSEGEHEIHIQLFNEDDEYFYTSAIIRATNYEAKQFATIKTYTDYFTSGIHLESPSWGSSYVQSENKYTIKGMINPDISETKPI